MPFPARRLGSALVTAGLAVATLASVPTAGATALHRGSDPTDWFTDPLTTAQRAALVRVPTHPSRYDGKALQRTRALYRSYDGSLAVPVAQSVGHLLVTGQAVTFEVPLSFPNRPLTGAAGRRLASLRTSLASATRVRCEGYVRFGGDDPSADPRASRLRSQAFCRALASGRPDLETRSVGYGSSRPVVIGGPVSRQHTLRAANRRVVVIVTRTAPAPTVAPGTVALTGITLGDAEAKVTFARPAAGTSPITGYQYTLDDGVSWNDLDIGDPDADPLIGTVPDLTNGRQYSIRVRAVSDDGDGTASEPVTGTPVPAPPAVVRPAAVELGYTFGDGSVSISFAEPSAGSAPITKYQWTKDGGTTWTDLAYTGSGQGPLFATITGLTNGTSYTIRVRALSAAGGGDPSDPVSGTPTAPVIEPGQVVLDGPFSFGDTTATLSFAAPAAGSDPITRYEYRLGTGGWSTLTTTGTDPLSATITGLTNGTSYAITVRAVSVAGPGDASEPLIGTPASAVVKPGPPTLTGVAFGDGRAVLTFDAPTDPGSAPITRYQAYVEGAGWDDIVTTGTGPFTATVTGLTNGTSYTLKVRAVSSAGKGTASNAATGTPQAAPVVDPPDQITGLSADPGDASAVLTFPAPDPGTGSLLGYEYAMSGSNSWLSLPVDDPAADPLSGTVSGLTNGTTYHLVVRAVSTDGPGPASDPVDVTPVAATAPGTPNLNEEDSYWDGGTVTFWIDNPIVDGGSPITGYEMSVDGGGWTALSYDPDNAQTPTGSYVGSGCGLDSHSFRVRAQNNVGTSGSSNTVTLEHDYNAGFARRRC